MAFQRQLSARVALAARLSVCAVAAAGVFMVTVCASGCGGDKSSPSKGDAGADSSKVASDAGQTSADGGHGDAGNGDTGVGADEDGAARDSAGATSDGGPGDGGDAGGGFTFGDPITAPAGQWTWIPFPGAFCGDGSPTGIGVNLGAPGARALIYLEGGGLCYSQLTCYTLMTAANFTGGYDQAQFAQESTDPDYLALSGGFFDRTAAANPFQEWSYVYVPYCTGDEHAGSNVVQYGTETAMHVGFRNFTAYLERLVPTFAAADRVVLAGSSTGGMGAAFNWWQTQQAFGATRVDLLDDSGTFMPADVVADGNGAEATERAQWNLAATLPPGCADCATSLAALYGFDAKAFPASRGALLSRDQDSVLPADYGITTAQFQAGLQEDETAQFVPNTNLQFFVAAGAGHVLFFQPALAQNGVTMQQFVTEMVTDAAGWSSVHP